MKTPLFSAVILAAMLPVTALASVATEQAFEAIHEPLSAKAPSADQVIGSLETRSTLGQSEAMARAFYNVSLETHHSTELPTSEEKAPVASKPLDW